MGILTKIFGSKSDREIKKILPTVKEVNQFYDSLEDKDISFLKNRTKELQSIIKKAIDDQESSKLKNIDCFFLVGGCRIAEGAQSYEERVKGWHTSNM